MKKKLLLSAVGLLAMQSANAAYTLTNGDFSTNDLTGWTSTGTVSAATGAAVLSASATLRQDFSEGTAIATAENYNFDMNFTFSVSANNINQRIRIRDNNNLGDIVTLRFNATGTAIERFSGGAWGNALTGITISPNTTYFMRILGRDFDDAGRNFTVGFSTDGSSYTTSSPLTAFHIAGVGSDFETIQFDSGSGATLTVDNISIVVPEPSTALLGGLGLLGLLRRRRA